ncbi:MULTISPECIES: hypothetical protein [unclassified Blastococcus]
MPAPTDQELFDIGDLPPQHGGVVRGTTVAYTTYGTPNADESNAILHPTWSSAWHDAHECTIEPGLACDPGRYSIVAPKQIDNGLSSSPSNPPPPFNRPYFAPVTVVDEVETPVPAAHAGVGHRVPGAGQADDRFIDRTLRELLDRPVRRSRSGVRRSPGAGLARGGGSRPVRGSLRVAFVPWALSGRSPASSAANTSCSCTGPRTNGWPG